MPTQPLFEDDDSGGDEPELIPRREARSSEFSKPFEIKATWLVLIGTGLLAWRISLSGWRPAGDANSLWLLLAVPLGWLWWKLRRWRPASKSRSSRSDDERATIRLVDEVDDETSHWKLVAGLIGYVLAVLTLIALAVWRMLA